MAQRVHDHSGFDYDDGEVGPSVEHDGRRWPHHVNRAEPFASEARQEEDRRAQDYIENLATRGLMVPTMRTARTVSVMERRRIPLLHVTGTSITLSQTSSRKPYHQNSLRN